MSISTSNHHDDVLHYSHPPPLRLPLGPLPLDVFGLIILFAGRDAAIGGCGGGGTLRRRTHNTCACIRTHAHDGDRRAAAAAAGARGGEVGLTLVSRSWYHFIAHYDGLWSARIALRWPLRMLPAVGLAEQRAQHYSAHVLGYGGYVPLGEGVNYMASFAAAMRGDGAGGCSAARRRSNTEEVATQCCAAASLLQSSSSPPTASSPSSCIRWDSRNVPSLTVLGNAMAEFSRLALCEDAGGGANGADNKATEEGQGGVEQPQPPHAEGERHHTRADHGDGDDAESGGGCTPSAAPAALQHDDDGGVVVHTAATGTSSANGGAQGSGEWFSYASAATAQTVKSPTNTTTATAARGGSGAATAGNNGNGNGVRSSGALVNSPTTPAVPHPPKKKAEPQKKKSRSSSPSLSLRPPPSILVTGTPGSGGRTICSALEEHFYALAEGRRDERRRRSRGRARQMERDEGRAQSSTASSNLPHEDGGCPSASVGGVCSGLDGSSRCCSCYPSSSSPSPPSPSKRSANIAGRTVFELSREAWRGAMLDGDGDDTSSSSTADSSDDDDADDEGVDFSCTLTYASVGAQQHISFSLPRNYSRRFSGVIFVVDASNRCAPSVKACLGALADLCGADAFPPNVPILVLLTKTDVSPEDVKVTLAGEEGFGVGASGGAWRGFPKTREQLLAERRRRQLVARQRMEEGFGGGSSGGEGEGFGSGGPLFGASIALDPLWLADGEGGCGDGQPPSVLPPYTTDTFLLDVLLHQDCCFAAHYAAEAARWTGDGGGRRGDRWGGGGGGGTDGDDGANRLAIFKNDFPRIDSWRRQAAASSSSRERRAVGEAEGHPQIASASASASVPAMSNGCTPSDPTTSDQTDGDLNAGLESLMARRKASSNNASNGGDCSGDGQTPTAAAAAGTAPLPLQQLPNPSSALLFTPLTVQEAWLHGIYKLSRGLLLTMAEGKGGGEEGRAQLGSASTSPHLLPPFSFTTALNVDAPITVYLSHLVFGGRRWSVQQVSGLHDDASTVADGLAWLLGAIGEGSGARARASTQQQRLRREAMARREYWTADDLVVTEDSLLGASSDGQRQQQQRQQQAPSSVGLFMRRNFPALYAGVTVLRAAMGGDRGGGGGDR